MYVCPDHRIVGAADAERGNALALVCDQRLHRGLAFERQRVALAIEQSDAPG